MKDGILVIRLPCKYYFEVLPAEKEWASGLPKYWGANTRCDCTSVRYVRV